MDKRNLEILGLAEGAGKEEIQAAYDGLRAKYLEERFLDGEAGNNAARMLTKIDAAYSELMTELNEQAAGGGEEGASFEKVEQFIRDGDIAEAQRALDAFNERNARWHYLQSVVFYRKNWMNESKKQLEIAMRLDAENEKYKEEYRKLNDKINSGTQSKAKGDAEPESIYRAQDMSDMEDDQMGGNFCSECITCCYINMCVNCLCNACCR